MQRVYELVGKIISWETCSTRGPTHIVKHTMKQKCFSFRALSEVSLCCMFRLQLVTLRSTVLGSVLDSSALLSEPTETTAPKTGNEHDLGDFSNSTALLSELSKTTVPRIEMKLPSTHNDITFLLITDLCCKHC
jgi:hypothetical protein